VDALAIHVVDGIAAATAYADDFDDAFIFLGLIEIDDARSIVGEI
jgi:hypothetical protein